MRILEIDPKIFILEYLYLFLRQNTETCLLSSQSKAEGVLDLSAAELREDVGALIISQSEPSMKTD